MNLSRPATRVNALAFSHEGRTLAVAAEDGIELWDMELGALKDAIPKRSAEVTPMAWSPEGDKLVVAWSDDTVLVRDVLKQDRVFELKIINNEYTNRLENKVLASHFQFSRHYDAWFVSLSDMSIIEIQTLSFRDIELRNQYISDTLILITYKFINNTHIFDYDYAVKFSNNKCFCYNEGEHPLIVGCG